MSNYIIYNGELYHHGVKGMKWGVRRYQNPDGTLTKAGLRRQARMERKESIKRGKEIKKELKANPGLKSELSEQKLSDLKAYQTNRVKKITIAAAATLTAVGIGVAAYKINDSRRNKQIAKYMRNASKRLVDKGWDLKNTSFDGKNIIFEGLDRFGNEIKMTIPRGYIKG